MQEKWEKIINLIGKESLEIHTYVKGNRKYKWFSVTSNGKNIYIDNAKKNFPSSDLTKIRELTFKEFEKVYPLYLTRENGEIIGEERRKKSNNSSYWFAIIKYILEK